MLNRRKPMKRSPLKRAGFRKRSRPIGTKSRIGKRKKSSPAKAYAKKVEPVRHAWKMQQRQVCMLCGKRGTEFAPLTVHEIHTKARAPKRWGHTSNYLLLHAAPCHVPTVQQMPVVRQLALKLAKDPRRFRLTRWLRIGDKQLKAPERVTMGDVQKYLEGVG